MRKFIFGLLITLFVTMGFDAFALAPVTASPWTTTTNAYTARTGLVVYSTSEVNALITSATNGLATTNYAKSVTNNFTALVYTNPSSILYTSSLPALTNGFVTSSVTNGLATTNYVNSATQGLTNGLATTNYVNSITNGLATTNYVNAATNGFVTSSITNGLATTNYVNAATNGFVTSSITNGLATTNYVNAATNGLVTSSVTNGLATTNYVNNATNGLVTSAITNGLATTNYANSVTNNFTSIVYSNPAVFLYTNALPALTNGFVTSSITNGLATTNYVNTATNGHVTASVTNGLASIAYVNSVTNGGNAALATNLVSGITVTNLTIAGSSANTNWLRYSSAGQLNTNTGSQIGRLIDLSTGKETMMGTNGRIDYLTYTSSNNTVSFAGNGLLVTNISISSVVGLTNLTNGFTSIVYSNPATYRRYVDNAFNSSVSIAGDLTFAAAYNNKINFDRSSGGFARLVFYNVGSEVMDFGLRGDSPVANTVQFSSYGAPLLAITPSGNVGIGMNTPTFTLDIAGSIGNSIDGNLFLESPITVSTSAIINSLNENSDISDTAGAILTLNNADPAGQLKFIFSHSGVPLGGARVDYAGDFHWHSSGAQGHQFWSTLDGTDPAKSIGYYGFLFYNDPAAHGQISDYPFQVKNDTGADVWHVDVDGGVFASALTVKQAGNNASINWGFNNKSDYAYFDLTRDGSPGVTTLGIMAGDANSSGIVFSKYGGGLIAGNMRALGLKDYIHNPYTEMSTITNGDIQADNWNIYGGSGSATFNGNIKTLASFVGNMSATNITGTLTNNTTGSSRLATNVVAGISITNGTFSGDGRNLTNLTYVNNSVVWDGFNITMNRSGGMIGVDVPLANSPYGAEGWQNYLPLSGTNATGQDSGTFLDCLGRVVGTNVVIEAWIYTTNSTITGCLRPRFWFVPDAGTNWANRMTTSGTGGLLFSATSTNQFQHLKVTNSFNFFNNSGAQYYTSGNTAKDVAPAGFATTNFSSIKLGVWYDSSITNGTVYLSKVKLTFQP